MNSKEYLGTIKKRTSRITKYFVGYVFIFLIINFTIEDYSHYLAYYVFNSLAGISIIAFLIIELLGYLKRLKIKTIRH